MTSRTGPDPNSKLPTRHRPFGMNQLTVLTSSAVAALLIQQAAPQRGSRTRRLAPGRTGTDPPPCAGPEPQPAGPDQAAHDARDANNSAPLNTPTAPTKHHPHDLLDEAGFPDRSRHGSCQRLQPAGTEAVEVIGAIDGRGQKDIPQGAFNSGSAAQGPTAVGSRNQESTAAGSSRARRMLRVAVVLRRIPVTERRRTGWRGRGRRTSWWCPRPRRRWSGWWQRAHAGRCSRQATAGGPGWFRRLNRPARETGGARR
jgi:hypothetical protein